jgi:glycosyltransferase involved in cell wall biosynthesis
MLAARLGERASPQLGLSWSFTAHGTDIVSDSPARLAAKLRLAPLVVCVSHAGRAQLMRMVGEEHWDKIRVIRCGLDDRWRTPLAKGPKRAEAGGRDSLCRLLVVGRLESEKGHSLLLDAVAELRDRDVSVALELVGDGSARGRLEARARALGIDRQVVFAGKDGGDGLRARYARADLFCLPSLGEGVPVVLMEAMAAGLAVVATAVGGVPELVEDGVSGTLVAPGDPAALADAIAALAADVERRRGMGEAGRARVLAEFGVERAALLLFERFSRLADDLGEAAAGPEATGGGPREGDAVRVRA